MKKIGIFIVLITGAFAVLNAQNESKDEIYKQVAGDNTFEVNFDPGKIFGSNQGDQFSLFSGGIKYRNFITETKAFRLGVNLSFASATDITQQSDPIENKLELKDNYNLFAIGIQPGFEKHFGKNKRFSPYIGFQFLIGYQTTTYKSENQETQSIYVEKWINDPEKTGIGYISAGAGLLAGFDFYFVQKLYLGLELGYGIEYADILKTKYTNERYSNLDEEYKNGNAWRVSPTLATGNIRLGWTFK